MKAKLKTREQLVKEGWKRACNGLYLGESKQRSTHFIGLYALHYLLGQEVEIIDMRLERDCDGPRVTVRLSQHEHNITWLAIDGNIGDYNPSKIKKYAEVKSFGDLGTAKFDRTIGKFHFPCSMSKMSKSDARRVMLWVKKVLETKRAPGRVKGE